MDSPNTNSTNSSRCVCSSGRISFRYHVTIHTDDTFGEYQVVGRNAALFILRGFSSLWARLDIRAEYVNKGFLDWDQSLSYNEPEEEEVVWG